MIKCANCPADAEYTYAISEEFLINYCEEHLPKFLISRKTSGQLNLVVPAIVEDVVEEPVKSSKKKTSDPVVEDVPEEEPVTE
jgi:hypothetical protein